VWIDFLQKNSGAHASKFGDITPSPEATHSGDFLCGVEEDASVFQLEVLRRELIRAKERPASLPLSTVKGVHLSLFAIFEKDKPAIVTAVYVH